MHNAEVSAVSTAKTVLLFTGRLLVRFYGLVCVQRRQYGDFTREKSSVTCQKSTQYSVTSSVLPMQNPLVRAATLSTCDSLECSIKQLRRELNKQSKTVCESPS